jgi:formylglycine-generating enzyme required for sulfatase activity
MIRKLLPLGLLLATVGCAQGKDPPETTKMVAFATISGPFAFGTGQKGCGIPKDEAECKEFDDLGKTFPPGIPVAKVQVAPFALDEHEVTNEQYRFCVEMDECSLPAGDNGPGGIEDYFLSEAFNDFPVVFVRWRQAVEYCKFVGKRLPTEFEWEYAYGGAATSPDDKRIFPWTAPGYVGPLATCDKDVNLTRCNGGLQRTRRAASSKDDVVTSAAGPLYDLAGNVSEWTSSDYIEKVTCDAEQPYTCASCVVCLAEKSEELCKASCQSCLCGADSTPTGKPNCYSPCNTPICPQFKVDAPPKNGSYTAQNLSTKRVIRGGSFFNMSSNESQLQCTGRSDNRTFSLPADDNPLDYVGFRCAKSL